MYYFLLKILVFAKDMLASAGLGGGALGLGDIFPGAGCGWVPAYLPWGRFLGGYGRVGYILLVQCVLQALWGFFGWRMLRVGIFVVGASLAYII